MLVQKYRKTQFRIDPFLIVVSLLVANQIGDH
jgi:hypothetical protein